MELIVQQLPPELRLSIYEAIVFSQQSLDEFVAVHNSPAGFKAAAKRYEGQVKSFSFMLANETVFREAYGLIIATHPILCTEDFELAGMLRYWKKKAKVCPRHFVLDLSNSHTRFVADAMKLLDGVDQLQDVVIRGS